MSDRRLRDLERDAALGDPEAAALFAAELQRTHGFTPCLICGRFFPSYVDHDCDPRTGEPIYHGGVGLGQVRREIVFDSEYYDGRTSQTSFFVSFHTFNTVAPRRKYWGVDTNLQGSTGLPAAHSFQAHRIACLLPAGLDEDRRNWLLNNSYLQIRSASTELATIPGLLCYRDEDSGAEDWVIQIAGGQPEDVPFENRRGNEGIEGVDLTVNGVGIVFQALEAFRVILGTPEPYPFDKDTPILIRVAMAGFMVRRYS
jgi:hypothetical protein